MSVEVSKLAAKIGGSVITPANPDYKENIRRWAANAVKEAAVVVQVSSSADVAAALSFAKEAGLEVAVSGGRHSVSGASSSHGGLVIDLCKMRKVTVDTATNRIIAQGGCLWEDVDAEAAKYDLATVGGTVNDTGIGGLTLGGGFGYLTGQYGMVIDNLLNVEIVLASGEILQANKKENTDLFWAIRGGGCNFGVVTEFTYQAYHHPHPVYSGLLVFTPDMLESIVETINAWIEGDGKNPKCAFILATACPPPAFTPTFAGLIFYDGDESEGRRVFKPFFDLGPVADLTNTHPYVQQNAMLNQMMTPGYRRYLKATAIRHMTAPILRAIFEHFVEFTTHVGPDSAQSVCLFEYFPNQKYLSVPETDAAYANRGDWYNITILPTWGNRAEFDEYGKTWSNKLLAELASLEKTDESVPEGKEVVGKKGYFNGSMGDERVSTVFGQNYPRLRELKKKYDPEFVFRKWFAIVPAEK